MSTVFIPAAAYCRLYSLDGQNLVLTGCDAKVAVVDVHATVIMSQKYQNPLPTAISATYTFSMLAGSAIYSFEMVREDGTIVEGIVKEKGQAKREYQEAVRKGYTAGLGEEQTKDVFSISVGNIHPSETVTINLRFLQPLTDDEKKDQLRFTFPRAYAERYGDAPTWETATAATANQPFNLEMSIQQAGPITSVACPSGHSITFNFERPEGANNDKLSHFAEVTLNEPSGFLTQDVLIVITAANLDTTRCLIEPHPSPNHPTTAVGLTFVPRFKLPDVEGGMEYIFLVDRSGSMEGQSIKLVREALVVLLRGLPTKDTSFNLVSFGDYSTKLWPSSRNYTQETLDKATRHVVSLSADYGGTKISLALSTVYDSLQKPLKKPVSLLLLTDGGAWDVEECVKLTEAAVKDLPHDENKTFLRVFTVGTGDYVSTNTCDSIARAGNGISLYVRQGEAMTGKCSRLIRAARTPPVVDLEISWPGAEKAGEVESDDEDFEVVEPEKDPSQAEKAEETVNLFQTELGDDMEMKDVGPPPKSTITLPPPPPIQQAPLIITNLFSGTRTQIYAIVSETKHSPVLPTSIKVTGRVATTGAKVELDVPLTKLHPSPFHDSLKPLLHTLAAKALITDREDGKHSFHHSLSQRFAKDPQLEDAYLEKEIISLGTTYSLSSKHTSFVAVDRRNEEVVRSLAPIARTPGPVRFLAGIPPPPVVDRSLLHKYPVFHRPAFLQTDGPAPLFPHESPRTLCPPPMFPPPFCRPAFPQTGDDFGSESEDSEEMVEKEEPWVTMQRRRLQNMPADRIWAPLPPLPNTLNTPLDAGERLAVIAMLQSFNGKFEYTETLLEFDTINLAATTSKLSEANIEPDVASTLLAWSWLKGNAEDDAPGMIEKAEEYLRERLGNNVSLDEVLAQVLRLIQFL